MTTAISKSAWVKLYKQLQREAAKFPQYNYRLFTQRRIRDHFEANRSVTDIEQLQKLYQKGVDNLSVLHRQATIGTLYPPTKTIVEEKLARSH